MSTRRFSFVALAVLLGVYPLVAQRSAGRVGAYAPPTPWPQRARVFDLLHQRIAVSFDLPQHAVRGEVATRLVVTAVPTDTIWLDASNLTIDAAARRLGAIGGEAGRASLRSALAAERRVTVRAALTAALGAR